MHDLGWQEGKNIEYRIVRADGDMNRLDASASELLRQNVDVIVVGSAPLRRALQRANEDNTDRHGERRDPVGNGFVASLAKPGGNITGIANLHERCWAS
jgi:putative ABC transport system substrate-binding protein